MQMKQLIIFFAALLGFAVPAKAQSYVGTWEMFPTYGAPTRLVETPEYVYALAGTSLCGYDKSTGEVAAYNVANRLNGNKVTGIWFDPQKKYLFVVYEDYNIDLLYDDGRVINVPDLRDAAITADKTVNNVGFANGKAYVGTKSGMIVIDADHGAITESCLWGKNITHIAATDKKIVLFVGGGSSLYAGDIKGSHHNFDVAFKAILNGYQGITSLERLAADKVFYTNAANGVVIGPDGDAATTKFIIQNKTFTANNIQPTSKGLLLTDGTTLYYIAPDGTFTDKTFAAVKGQKVADWAGTAGSVWLADATGYGQYDVNASAYTIAKAKPRGTSGTNVGRIIQHPMTGNFYMSTVEQHANSEVYNLAYGKSTYIDVFNVSERTFVPLPSSLIRSSLTGFAIDSYNPDKIFTGFHGDGGRLIDIGNDTFIKYTNTNTAFPQMGSYTSMYVDSTGNLWICQKRGGEVNVGKALKGSWETDSKQNGWSYMTIPLISAQHSTRMVVDEDNGVIITTGKGGIAAIQMPESNMPLTASCRTAYLDCTTDEDGAVTGSLWSVPAITIDKNGWVWIGYDKGVLVIRDSREMFNSGFAPMRPKIARNDGTNLADYLLNQVEVFCIAVDENNQKWIGTLGSGLYRVSEDGTEILEHFTTENSDIPSNDVLAVCPDRNSNDIYIGTPEGLSIYHSTTVPAADDYKDAYAYPNPVTPDYTGYITITGLKANSLVKIADASGNTFFETRSDGGMAVWNGCDKSGRRVRSGVYFVFASEAGEGGTGAAVTKIVVVN
jgi:hypothetical protein